MKADNKISWEDERAGLLRALALLEQQYQAQQQMLYGINQVVTLLLAKTGGETTVTAEALERTQPLPFNVTPCLSAPGYFTIRTVAEETAAPGQVLVPSLKFKR